MNARDALVNGYRDALAAHLARGDEESLAAAYDLGRSALPAGRGVLDVKGAHDTAVETPSRVANGVAAPPPQPPPPPGPEALHDKLVGYERAALALADKPTEDELAEVLARHPTIKVAFAQVDEIDEDDAEMIVQVVDDVAKRGAEKRRRAGRDPGNAAD